MDSNDQLLWYFSAAFVMVSVTALVVPVLMRRIDVFTTWNLFLIGATIFTGLSGINCTKQGHYLATYTPNDYQLYYIGTIAFYSATALAYFFIKAPRRLAGRSLLRWPKLSGWVLAILTVTLSLFGLFQRFPIPIPFVGQLLFQFSVALPLLAFACAFIAWYRSPTNPLLIALLAIIGGWTLILVLGVGGSRRYLIAALAVAPVSLYWTWLRYKPTTVILGWIFAAAFIGVPVLKGFSAVRHSFRDTGVSGAARAVEIIKALPSQVVKGGSSDGFMGQDSVEVALMTIHLLYDNSDRLTVDPFFTIVYIVTNPVPRSLWEGKKESLGVTLPAAAKLHKQGINANLGVNVAAQCYYDGGLPIHFLYGIIFGCFLRYYDELLVRQPGNPLLIGGLVFMAPQIIGFPRGGIETMGLQIFLGFIAVVATGWIARLVFGSGLEYPRTDHLADYPILRSESDWARWMQSYTAVSAARAPRHGDRFDHEAD